MSKQGTRYFDNGGETFDRYSIIIAGSVYGMSHNATSPQGYNQYCGEDGEFDFEDVDSSMGEEIEWESLPASVKKAIKAVLDADIFISEGGAVRVEGWGYVAPEQFIREGESNYNYLADMPADLYKRVRERLIEAGLIE